MEDRPSYGQRAFAYLLIGPFVLVGGAALTSAQLAAFEPNQYALVIGWLGATFGFIFTLAGAIGYAIAEIHEERDTA